MKKIVSLLSVFAVSFAAYAQTTFQASVTKTAAANSVTVYLKPSATITDKVSSLTVTLAIPTSVGTRPTVTVDNAPNTYITYVIQNAIDQNISGTPHYIYNLLGTGDVVPAGSSVTFTAGVDNPMVRASFSGSSGVNSLVKMVNLPDGGTDPNPNSFFGFAIATLGDVVNESAMFYSIPTFSTANNNVIPGGYSGLSYSTTTELVPVPVRFTGFTVVKKDNDAVLSWSVTNETAITDRYEIERSVNGIDFAKVYTVMPKNNGSTVNMYELTDINLSAIRKSGAIYYRIKQVDKDGKSVYTEIRSIKLDAKGNIVSIYPNPVKEQANVSVDLDEASSVNITVINSAGKEMYKTEAKGFKGVNLYRVNMSTMPAGSYQVKVVAGADIKVIPVIKAN